MTRDARLSALHRGDFRPGAALPSPALPPDPCSDAPRSQVVMPGGRCPGPPEPAVTSRGRRTPLPAPPTGPSPEDALHERGCQTISYIRYVVKENIRYVVENSTAVPAARNAE